MDDALLTIDEAKVAAYSRTIARACRALRDAGLDDEAAALRDFATGRVQAARDRAHGTDAFAAEIADLARRTAA